MKPPRLRIRTLLILVAMTAVILAGVALALRRPGRPYSVVFDGFNPVDLLGSEPGFSTQSFSEGSFNRSQGGAVRTWQGSIMAPEDPSTLRTIRDRIDDYIKKISQGRYHVEGSLAEGVEESSTWPRSPSHLVFVFNEGDRHGELHVWLFPDSNGRAVGYAIFLQDERLEPE